MPLYSVSLKHLINNYLQPYAEDEKQIELSLTNFRTRYVWQDKINKMLFTNLQGIMQVFTVYKEAQDKIWDITSDKQTFEDAKKNAFPISDKVFTIKCAQKLIEDAKYNIGAEVLS
jgi:hypothetical protein